MIFRRQIIYFIILIMIEIPYSFYIVAMSQLAPNLSDPKILKIYMSLRPIFGVVAAVFLTRGLLLSLVRLAEPRFLHSVIVKLR